MAQGSRLKVSQRAHSLHLHVIHGVTCLSVRCLFSFCLLSLSRASACSPLFACSLSCTSTSRMSNPPRIKPSAHPHNEEYCPMAMHNISQCRCAVVLRSHVGLVVFTNLQHDEGVSTRLEHPPLALVRELLVQLQPGTFPKPNGSRAPPSAWTPPCVASLVQGSPHTFNPNFWLMLILPRRRTFRPPLAPVADDDGL